MHHLRRFALRLTGLSKWSSDMEALMQYVWQFRLWPITNMVTTDGRRIQIIDPGLLNHDAGPDFFNAKITVGGEHWIGNIEIHVRASDWFRHRHDKDKAYDSVILHVVDVDDAVIYRSNGERIPQMVMRCTPDFAQKYNDMVNNQFRELPCGSEIATVPQIYLTDWLSALAFERLYAKVDRIKGFLQYSQNNWSEAIYVTLARALGFSTNSEPFQLLAQTTPLKNMLHHSDSLIAVEAMLFGQAGLLEGFEQSTDPYIRRLVTEYKFMCAKYSLTRSNNIWWKMSKMRPQNFPHRRIAALARMICSDTLFTNNILEVKDEVEARQLFDVKLDGYWKTHYSFSPQSNAENTNALSGASINVLLINVVIPVIFAYALANGDLKRQERAIDLLQSLRPETNRITQIYARAGIVPKDAFTTQAMIQLKHEYCEPRKCLYCRIGHRLLSQKVVRI